MISLLSKGLSRVFSMGWPLMAKSKSLARGLDLVGQSRTGRVQRANKRKAGTQTLLLAPEPQAFPLTAVRWPTQPVCYANSTKSLLLLSCQVMSSSS